MLEFFVDGQNLKRGDRERLVAGSVGFVEFCVHFDPCWANYTKTLLVRNTLQEDTYCVFDIKDGGINKLPHEVLVPGGEVELSVFGAGENAACATANSVRIPVEPNLSSADVKESLEPSPTLFEQICEQLRETLKRLPGKNLMLKGEEDGIYWKSEEEDEWSYLVSSEVLRGEDGTRWFGGARFPAEAKEGDFFFSEQTGDIYRKEKEQWRLCAQPGTAQKAAEEAAQTAQRAAKAAEEAAAAAGEVLDPPNLFPEGFEVWNQDGAILNPVIGKALAGYTLPPDGETFYSSVTYRIPVTPGKTYVFTPPRDSGTGCSFAVGDADGICLDFTYDPIEEYEVKLRYDGLIPTHVYYCVTDELMAPVVFKEQGVGALKTIAQNALATAQEAKDAFGQGKELFSNALKGSASGGSLFLCDLSPLEHTLKVKADTGGASLSVCGLNLWDEEVEIGSISTGNGLNTENSNVLRSKNYIRLTPNEYYYITCPSGLFASGGLIQIYRYDENKNFLGYGSTGVENGNFQSRGWHYIRFVIRKEYGLTYHNDICLSKDNPATNGRYEPYKGSTYTADEEGNVEGVKSRYPVTTLTAAEGVTLNVEYNRDLNKAYGALAEAIKALGGSV